MIKIHLYIRDYQSGIKEMMNDIVKEFESPISLENKVGVPSLDKYWLAINNKEVIGTIGVLKINESTAIVKNLFVKKEFRGKEYDLAQMLLFKVIAWSNSENIASIYLGTMTQFKAAHKFYEKHGFEKISTNRLPSSFTRNPLDEIFYKKDLK